MTARVHDFRAAADRPHLGRRPATNDDTEDTPMAGRRQTSGRPRQEHLRAQRRLAQLNQALDDAKTLGDRVAAAADFLRGALKQADPATAEAITAGVVRVLTDAGTRALDARKGPTGEPAPSHAR